MCARRGMPKNGDAMPTTRRELLRGAVVTAAGGFLFPAGCAPQPTVVRPDADALIRMPGKIPMRLVNDRPPCLETPWRYYKEDLTPNEAFYVRWHLQAIPQAVDLKSWRLRIDGAVDHALELSMDDLKRLGEDEVTAVNQCSGNSRSLFAPRVAGSQWRNGAMGNARWAGVSLATLLRRAGVRAGAVDVTFDGLDEGTLSSVPDFVKSLTIDHALQPEVLVAFSMNGKPLPHLNGFPARLAVPGWYSTYWVKALHRITVLPHAYDGYWMAKAYKIPATPLGLESPDHLAAEVVPINRMDVRSFFTAPDPNFETPLRGTCDVEGIAFDGGSGIRAVDVSDDDGATWSQASLGDDLGRYSFRRWRYSWTPTVRGSRKLLVRATANDGQIQPSVAGWNRGGYMRNVIEELVVKVV
jgi:sulfite dehydrogenase (cytochrome) subunit A